MNKALLLMYHRGYQRLHWYSVHLVNPMASLCRLSISVRPFVFSPLVEIGVVKDTAHMFLFCGFFSITFRILRIFGGLRPVFPTGAFCASRQPCDCVQQAFIIARQFYKPCSSFYSSANIPEK